MAKIISKAYGEALFELAIEKNELDSIQAQRHEAEKTPEPTIINHYV